MLNVRKMFKKSLLESFSLSNCCNLRAPDVYLKSLTRINGQTLWRL